MTMWTEADEYDFQEKLKDKELNTGEPVGNGSSIYEPFIKIIEGGKVELKFPTMLRKMWSGSEVKAWLDELPPLYSQGCINQLLGEIEVLKDNLKDKFTAFQNPHNDDEWLESPSDCEILQGFGSELQIGFEYEVLAGSYETQRYRVTKIADDESDDIEVEIVNDSE